MPRKSLFKRHRFPRDIILFAVRWYLRYPLSYQRSVTLDFSRPCICHISGDDLAMVSERGSYLVKLGDFS